MFEKISPDHPEKLADRIVEDEDMTITEPHENVVETAGNCVNDLGGFEKMAEWGLV